MEKKLVPKPRDVLVKRDELFFGGCENKLTFRETGFYYFNENLIMHKRRD